MRSVAGEGWQAMDFVPFDREAEIQELLFESPGLIPMDEVDNVASPLIIAMRELAVR